MTSSLKALKIYKVNPVNSIKKHFITRSRSPIGSEKPKKNT
jgi:hypothetical protein